MQLLSIIIACLKNVENELTLERHFFSKIYAKNKKVR